MKYRTEKVVHEIIRDLPKAARLETMLDRGEILIEDALSGIADAIRAERQRSSEAAETK